MAFNLDPRDKRPPNDSLLMQVKDLIMGNALTKEEILKEIVKAGKDPVYFTTSYCRISHPQRGLIPFKCVRVSKRPY